MLTVRQNSVVIRSQTEYENDSPTEVRSQIDRFNIKTTRRLARELLQRRKVGSPVPETYT